MAFGSRLFLCVDHHAFIKFNTLYATDKPMNKSKIQACAILFLLAAALQPAIASAAEPPTKPRANSATKAKKNSEKAAAQDSKDAVKKLKKLGK